MHIFVARFSLPALVLVAMSVFASIAAAEASKEACVEAHSRGQDAREQGRISLARKLFMTCAQSSCPSVVQNDCARFADQLERVQPSLSFSARDAGGNDLPDTTVYVDDVLVVTRLDGKAHDVDPGKHVVRFEHGGAEKVLTIVVGSGEKGRAVVSTFENVGVAAAPADGEAPAPEVGAPRARGPRIAMGLSAAMIVGGGALGVVGLLKVPDNCKLSDHQCAAPPGDSSFDDAEKAVRLSNVGWVVGGLGVAALAASIIWHVRSDDEDEGSEQRKAVTPYATPDGAGIAVTGRM